MEGVNRIKKMVNLNEYLNILNHLQVTKVESCIVANISVTWSTCVSMIEMDLYYLILPPQRLKSASWTWICVSGILII